MDRKALVIFILLLSTLVVLFLLHNNQQALAPAPSPAAEPTAAVSVKPYSAMLDMAANATPNATAARPTPSPIHSSTLQRFAMSP